MDQVRADAAAGIVWVLGFPHYPGCLVARYPDPDTWDDSGFPWCGCRREEAELATP